MEMRKNRRKKSVASIAMVQATEITTNSLPRGSEVAYLEKNKK